MWILAKQSTPRVFLRRIFTLLTASLIVAGFVTVFTTSTTVNAAPAVWNGNTLTYEGNDYALSQNASLPASDVAGKTPYRWVDDDASPQRAHVIYFDSDQPQDEDAAELIIYDFSPPDTYSNGSSPQTIEVTVNPTGPEVDNETLGTTCSSSAVPNIGWLLCPLSNYVADGVDMIYSILNDFLEVPAVATDTNSGIYQLWGVIRTIANLSFVLAFIIIIYSQLTSIGFSNYNIKAMLPRLIIAAVLVNISFWICALAIDISNLLGHSVNSVLVNVRENMDTNADVSWSNLTTYILSAGAIGGAVLGFSAAVSGSFIGLGFLLVAALASVGFAVFVGFVILAARQALITILLILSPLAFVAFVLPSTQSWFDRWRKSFTTLLVFFPLFAVLFAGSSLAGHAIMNNADGKLHIVLIGMATMVIPLVLTPLLVQFSSGLLGRIASVANNTNHGWSDRMKNWARDNADYHASNKRAKTAEHMTRDKRGLRARGVGRLGLAMDQSKRRREKRKAFNEEYLGNRADKDWQERVATGERRSDRRIRQQYLDSHDLHKAAETYKTRLDQESDRHWRDRLDVSSKGFDEKIFKATIDTAEIKGQTEQMEANFNAIVAEMKAGVNAYAGASSEVRQKLGGVAGMASLDDQAARMNKTVDDTSLEQARQQSAELEMQSKYAQRLKGEEDLRQYAGGVQGDAGAARAYAKAKSQISSEFMENVKNSRTTLDDYSINELINLTHKKELRGGKKATEAEVMAGIQEIMLAKGNNWSAQKLHDHVAAAGMHYNEADNTYYENYNEATDTYSGAISADEAESRRTTQQIFVDAAKQSGLKIKNFSGTDRGNAEAGLFRADTKTAILRDMRDLKISATRWAETDVDELMRTVQVLRDDSARLGLEPDALNAVNAQIQRAFDNPDIADTIGQREKEIMEVIQSYATAERRPLDVTEKQAFEAKAKTPIPTYYDIDRFYGRADKYGGSEPTGPR